MANNKIHYTLTTSAPSRPKGVLCVVVSYKGTPNGRKSFMINGLNNPNFRYWDKKTKRFSDGTDTAKLNNPVLNEICYLCDELLTNSQISTPRQFVDALKIGTAPKDVLTLGGFVSQIIDEMRNGTNNKRPSRNYQVYRNLLHKLERESNLINIPIADISNAHFILFSDFILSLSDDEGKSNYLNLMKLFKQVHKKAFDREKNSNILRFKYTDTAPLTDDIEKKTSLTLKQIQQFNKLDLTAISQSGVKADFYKELYHDFCMFLYETKTRPVDVIRAHSNNIVTLNGRKFLKYIAEKKKNTRGRDKIVYSPLSDTALQIIAKYKGKSSQGYILPFSMNEYKWDFLDADSWNNWNNRKAHVLEMINTWLKKVQSILKIDFPLTSYTFRHSALSHACMSKGANYMQIALDAGTSPDMLLKHYVSNVI